MTLEKEYTDIKFDNQVASEWYQRREIFLYIFTNEALLIEMPLLSTKIHEVTVFLVTYYQEAQAVEVM